MNRPLNRLEIRGETRDLLRSAGLRTYNAILNTTDLELYHLFQEDISRVKEIREAVAVEMEKLGHWKPKPGETREWRPDAQLYWETNREAAEERAIKEKARMTAELEERQRQRASEAAEDAEYWKQQAIAVSVTVAELAALKRLGFSARTANCLYNEGLLTIEAIAKVSDRKLLQIPNFGRVSLRQVRTAVAAAKPRVRVKALTAPYRPVFQNSDSDMGILG